MARKFFYVCAGMLMLALSYHFGFSTAVAQATGPLVAIATDGTQAVLWANGSGDVYALSCTGSPYSGGTFNGLRYYVGNVFSAGPVPTQRETWGQLKARYR